MRIMGRPAHRLGRTVCEVSAVAPIATKFGQHGEMALCAISGLTHRSKKAPLFGHLVGIRGTGFMERRHASLIRLDVCELDYLGPLLHVF